jgi:hypothetical protein
MKLSFSKPVSISVGLFLILLPWILILGFVSPLANLFHFILVVIGLVCVGLLVLNGVVAPLTLECRVMLSLPLGFLVVCGLIALGVRFGISPSLMLWIAACLAVLGFGRLYSKREDLKGLRVDGLWGLVVLSLLIALIYFLPGAIRDGVILADGSYNWMYVDTQYQTAIASSVKSSLNAPRLPDMGIVDLRYHFGPYSLAGSLSAATGIPVGDAVARVVRPAALVALLLASSVLGGFLGRTIEEETMGGILAPTGLFFYGSLASLFENVVNSSSLISGALLFELPYVGVLGQGGPFASLIVGHSELHGLIALVTMLVILLVKLKAQEGRYLAPDAFAFGPAILFPISLVVGIAFLGLTVLLLFWFGGQHKRTWLTVFIALVSAIFAAWVMGYIGSPMTGRIEFSPLHFTAEGLHTFFVWFCVGLGIRLYALTKIENPFREPIFAALLILFSGFVLFGMFFRDYHWGNTSYGFRYSQALLSIFSFAWLSGPVHAAFRHSWPEVYSPVTQLFRFLLASSVLFLLSAGLLWLIPGISERYDYDPRFSIDPLFSIKLTLMSSGLLLLLSFMGLILMGRSLKLRRVLAVSTIAVYLVGFVAWIPPWVNFGLGRMQMDVKISGEEVRGLRLLHEISAKGDLIATNQHSLPGFRQGATDRSYAYGALSERPILLEGWQAGGAENHPLFKDVKKANDLLFSTNDPAVVWDIVKSFNIRFLVARPDTDIALPTPRPTWLQKVEDTGTLTVYQVLR